MYKYVVGLKYWYLNYSRFVFLSIEKGNSYNGGINEMNAIIRSSMFAARIKCRGMSACKNNCQDVTIILVIMKYFETREMITSFAVTFFI
jgi:hypothetical protein